MLVDRGTRRVLVVEDDVLSNRALTALIRHVGYEVVGVSTVDEARELLDDQTHVITDLLLKDGTTIELLLAIRKHPHPPRVAVVTASDREAQVVRQAAALEPDVMLQTPVDANALLDWLAADPA